MSLLKPKAFMLLRKVLIVGKNKQIKTCDSCGMIIKSRTPGMTSVTVKLKNRENQTQFWNAIVLSGKAKLKLGVRKLKPKWLCDLNVCPGLYSDWHQAINIPTMFQVFTVFPL